MPPPLTTHTKPTAQQYIEKHKLHAVLDELVLPIVKRRDPRPHEALSLFAPGVAVGTPASAMALLSAGSVTPSDLASLDFDAFPLYNKQTGSSNLSTSTTTSSGALHALAQKIFEAHGLLTHFKIDAPSFLQWIATVEANYHAENPFHNFLHAFNVLQTTNVFVTALQKETGNAIGKVELFAMFVAAICHDLQHPGVTNQFLILTNDPLALRYGDRSVLESHHCAATLSLFFGPSVQKNSSILRNMTPTVVSAFRKLLVEFILGTDLAQHGGVVARLSGLVDKIGFMEKEKSKKILLGPIAGEDDFIGAKTTFLKAIVKAADISNEARAFDFSQRWAPLVKEEFYQQGDLQKKLGHVPGVDIAAAFDRDDEKGKIYFDQVGFIDHLCMPLYNVLERISPSAFGVATGNLKANCSKWKQLQPGYAGSPVTQTPSVRSNNNQQGGGNFPSSPSGSASPVSSGQSPFRVPLAGANTSAAGHGTVKSMVPPEETEDDDEEYDDDDEL